MPKDVKYIILEFSANVVAISTKIIDLPIIQKCQTHRPVKCKGVQKHILHQNVRVFGVNGFRIIFPWFSYQVPKNKNTETPRSSLTSIGIPYRTRCRAVLNAYSMVTSYQVPSSLKYYSMPRSVLNGYWHCLAYAALGSAKCFFCGVFLWSVK